MKTFACLLLVFALPTAALAGEPPDFIGEPDCRVARIALGPNESAAWTGPCKDGYADGAGVLQRTLKGLLSNKPVARYEVTMARGHISGAGSLKYPNGDTYTGTFVDGKRDGKGYMAYTDGGQYEGDYKDGKPHGAGIALSLDGSEYVGEWKKGRRDGNGTQTFALGGRYEGAWKAGRPEGKGVMTYAGSGHRFEGEFENGRARGAPALVTPATERYSIKRDGAGVREDVVSGFGVPVDKAYPALTPAQQEVVKMPYMALEDGDEPPFPLKGEKPIFDWIRQAQHELLVDGELTLYVLVGKDGNAVSVTAIGSPSKEMTKFATLVVGKEKYKPALCRGAPCEMIYPFRMKFKVDL